MAGRFIFQKFASGMLRSTSRLSANASASARATAPVIPLASEAGIRTLSDVIHGVARDTTSVIPASEAGFRTLSNVFHGAAAHPGMPNNHAIHAYAARYFNTFRCSRAAAKPMTGMPSTVVKIPAFLDSAGGMKRTCSSGATNKLGQLSRDKPVVDDVDSSKLLRNVMWVSTFVGFCLVTWSVPRASSSGHGRRGLHGCSGCCNCLAGGSRSK